MRFCAFLRGVNVNGTSMKMAEVCRVFEATGVSEVSSVLASGNILFSSELPLSTLKTSLEEAMSAHFQYEAFLFIKDKLALQQMLADVPFSADAAKHIYVFIGETGVEKMLEDEFKKGQAADGEKIKVIADNFYWQISKGITLTSDFGKILGNKRYKNLVTSRNINTVEKILQKL